MIFLLDLIAFDFIFFIFYIVKLNIKFLFLVGFFLKRNKLLILVSNIVEKNT